jgi:hypothetical protein
MCLLPFVAGAACSCRENGSSRSFRIMCFAVALDFMVSMLPMMGVAALQMNLPGSNGVITFAIVLGGAVWLLFIAALLVRRAGRLAASHAMMAITQIAWFIDFIAFLYGIDTFPLQS